MGLVMSPANYNQIALGNPFVTPIFPGTQAPIPNGTTAAQIAQAVRQHSEDLWQYKECCNLDKALTKLIMKAVNNTYLQTLQDRHNGYANVTTLQMLEHLMTNDGQLQPQEITANMTNLNKMWDGSTPLEDLIKQIENCCDFAIDGGAPIDEVTLVTSAYTNILNTDLYHHNCINWMHLPTPQRTWNNFKTHFLEEQCLQQLQSCNTHQAGFHSANTASESMMSNVEALANLATGVNTDRKAFAKLMKMNSKLMACVTTLEAEKENWNNNHNGNRRLPHGKKASVEDANRNHDYCSMQGYYVTSRHTSATCRMPGPNHNKDAMHKNNMGGNQAGK